MLPVTLDEREEGRHQSQSTRRLDDEEEHEPKVLGVMEVVEWSAR